MLELKNRTLFEGDNLDVLRKLPSESVNLVYIDPPFCSNRVYDATEHEMAAGASFDDKWAGDTDVVEKAWRDVSLSYDNFELTTTIALIEKLHSGRMRTYITAMSLRLVELWRILKKDGTIYVHCDSSASHYIKMAMDSIFGARNFRNEIIWRRHVGNKSDHPAPKNFGRCVDSIFRYSKSNDYLFNPVYGPAPKEEKNQILREYPYVDEQGRRYKVSSTPLFHIPSYSASKSLYYEYKGIWPPYRSGWRLSRKTLAAMDANGEIIWRNNARPVRKHFAKDFKLRGNRIDAIWTDIGLAMGKERVGYPTQKPLKLLQRIIEVSSHKGDIVLDAFCGSGTTCIAAESMGRRWVGIDQSDKAYEILAHRMKTGLKKNYGISHIKV